MGNFSESQMLEYRDKLKNLKVIPLNTWEKLGIFNNLEFLKEIALTSYFPDAQVIFRAFKETDYDDVKVVILGMDPYHDGSAAGLCFVPNSLKIPASLQNIIKEARTDIAEDFKVQDMLEWPSKGVLMLNAALTVEKGKAGSHLKLWENFTKRVIEELNKKDGIVWILWGKNAQEFKKDISSKHHIIEGGHPSPLNRTGNFLGGKYFSRANGYLEEKIEWQSTEIREKENTEVS